MPHTFFISDNRCAVAPIIATLLMVAIAIVGGILVFVFAQDLFNSSAIEAPTYDALVISGYNATSSTTLTLEIENNGKTPSLITEIEIQGLSHNVTDTTIKSGQLIELDVDYDGVTLKNGKSAKVTVITGNGNEFSTRITKGIDNL